jgi:hypothetical protein
VRPAEAKVERKASFGAHRIVPFFMLLFSHKTQENKVKLMTYLTRALARLAPFFVFAVAAFAQTAVLSPVARQQFFDANGKPLNGGKICSYAAGTTTPLATYATSSFATPNGNPVILDAGGFAGVWLSNAAYKFVLRSKGTDNTCATGTVQWTVDNITDPGNALSLALAGVNGGALVGYVPTGGTVQTTVQGALNTYLLDKGYNTFANACAAAAGQGKTLLVTQAWGVPATVTCAAPLWFLAGGIVKPAAAQTLTLSGTLTAPPTQNIFDITAAGIVLFSASPGPVYPQWFSSGSNDGAALVAAYASLPATGGTILAAADMALTATATLAVTGGKHFNLDLQAHNVNCSNTTGACLSVTHTSGGATVAKIMNGSISYTGASAVTGLQFINIADHVRVDDLIIRNFTTSGSYCMQFSNAENIVNGANCQDNYNGWLFTNFSTNILNEHARIENQNMSAAGKPIRIEQQSSGLTFHNVLVQTTHTVRGVEIDSTSGGAISEIRFLNCWFENIGDTTSSSRIFWLSANASHAIAHFTVENSVENSDTLGVLGTIYEFTGDGSAAATYTRISGNSIGGYANYITGSLLFPLFTFGDNTTFCDVCINKANNPGIFWAPQTGAHEYRMWAGDSVNLGDANNWTFKDDTSGFNVLHYVSSTRTLALPVAASTVPVAVASLPSCVEGAHAAVTDSNAANFAAGIGTTVVGGGTTHVPVYCDGTNWRIG